MPDGQPRRAPSAAWVQYLLGGLGAAWMIWAVGKMAWSLLPSLNFVGKALLGAIWLWTIAFAVSTLYPQRALTDVAAGDIGNVWAFIRGKRPTDPGRRALWHKVRRTVVFLAVWLVLWLAYGMAGTLGLTRV